MRDLRFGLINNISEVARNDISVKTYNTCRNKMQLQAASFHWKHGEFTQKLWNVEDMVGEYMRGEVRLG